MLPVLLSISDAAHWTHVPAGTIRRWLAEDRICRYGDSRPWLVDPAEIEQLRDTLAARACTTGPREQT